MYDRDSTVLIVDDYASMRRIMRNLLAHIGFSHVEEAEDGQSAIEKMRERKIGLVITDLNMTPMSGVEFVEAVRAHMLFKDTPIIVMTTDTEREQIRAARHAGANTYMIKPISPTLLQQKIDAVLSAPAIASA